MLFNKRTSPTNWRVLVWKYFTFRRLDLQCLQETLSSRYSVKKIDMSVVMVLWFVLVLLTAGQSLKGGSVCDEVNNALETANNRTANLTTVNAALKAQSGDLAAAWSATQEAPKEAKTKLANAIAVVIEALRTEMETRLGEKDEENDAIRTSGQRAIVKLRRTLVEVEDRYKSEITLLKKKYGADVRQLHVVIDSASIVNAQHIKQIKNLQSRIQELEDACP